MAVVNRCAITVVARSPMRDWTRPFQTRQDMEGLDDEASLYLIPTFESELEALQRLKDRCQTIFAAELELWCSDRSLWPAPLTFELYQAWFDTRFFPLVEDLGGEDLHTFEVEAQFLDDVRDALR